MEQYEKIVYEARYNNVTLARFDTLKEANKYVKQEINDSELEGFVDVYQLKEIMLQSIKKKLKK